jgi:hypothetical protein
MANEITYTGAGGNLRAAEILNAIVWENLRDMSDLRSLCVNLGDLGGSGSAKLETPTVTLNNAMAAANANETTAAANTALTSGAFSMTIAGQIIAYEISDLFAITKGPGGFGMEMLASAVADSYILRFTDMVCEAAVTLTNGVGSTGVDLTVDDIYSAQFNLTRSLVSNEKSCVLYPTQLTDFQDSLRSEGGAVQWVDATAAMLEAKGVGFVGRWNGVDFYSSDSVNSIAAGADSCGFMFGYGAFGYAEGSPSAALPGAMAAVVPAGSPVYAEFDRTANPGLSAIIGHAYVGVGVSEDDRGCRIITDR